MKGHFISVTTALLLSMSVNAAGMHSTAGSGETPSAVPFGMSTQHQSMYNAGSTSTTTTVTTPVTSNVSVGGFAQTSVQGPYGTNGYGTPYAASYGTSAYSASTNGAGAAVLIHY